MNADKSASETDTDAALATRIGSPSGIARMPAQASAGHHLFERFADSGVDGFREQFVRPFLLRLGFQGVSCKHNSNEFGRDYVFSQRDALGQVRHLLAIAEHVERLSQPKQAERLLTRIRQCFLASYSLPTASDEQRSLAGIYVFVSGTIGDEAIAHLRRSLAKTMAANIHFLDGPRLFWLADHVSQRDDSEVRERLEALVVQLRLNEHIWTTLRQGISSDNDPPTWDMRGGLLHGIEEFLSRPVLPEQISPVEVAMLWQRAKTIQAVAMRCYLATMPAAARAKDLKLLANVCQDAIASSAGLRERIADALGELSPATI